MSVTKQERFVKSALLVVAAVVAATPAVSIAQLIQPGKWSMVTTPTSMDMPGMPPAVVASLKGRPIRTTICITPEQARLGPEALAKAAPNCRYTRFNIRGSRIDSDMVCKQRTGTMTATASSNFTRTSFVSTGRSVTTGRQRMTVTSRTEGRRVGDCRK